MPWPPLYRAWLCCKDTQRSVRGSGRARASHAFGCRPKGFKFCSGVSRLREVAFHQQRTLLSLQHRDCKPGPEMAEAQPTVCLWH